MKKLALAFSLLASTAALVACGGGGDNTPTPLVASANLEAPVTASTVAAVTGKSFSFNSGVSALGTTSPTTVSVNSASTFSVTSAQGNASGNLSFGSCIFTVTASTFPAGSPLATGKVLEVQPCALEVPTAGVVTSAPATILSVTFNLGGAISAAQSFTIDVLDNGTVTVNGTTVGTVTVTPSTGATGGA